MPKLSALRLTKRLVEDAQPGSFISDSVLRGLGLRVTPAGAKAFVVSYRRPNGRQARQVIGSFPVDTVEQARTKAQLVLAGVKGGRDPSKERKTLREIPTVTALASYYLGEYAASRHLRESTIRDARTVLGYALPKLGSKQVVEVMIGDIRSLHGAVRHGVSRYQANRMLAVLKRMFALSIEQGWTTNNPCEGVGKFQEDERWRNLSHAEVGRLLDACDAYADQNSANAVRLLLFTGARLREVLSARWEQFDLDKGIWVKPSSHTKTNRQHWLELPEPALLLLRDMRSRTNSTFLFPGKAKENSKGERLEQPRGDLKRPWSWLVKRSGLVNIRIHDLRRTTASFMLNGGASLATVGSALGHTQAATTARYARLSGTVQRAALSKAAESMVSGRGI
jgi:integrase